MIEGYRLDWRGGDPCHYTVAMYEQEAEIYKKSAQVWTLHSEPQPGCSPEVAIYRGRWFVNLDAIGPNRDMSELRPLYLGPVINDAWAVYRDDFRGLPG